MWLRTRPMVQRHVWSHAGQIEFDAAGGETGKAAKGNRGAPPGMPGLPGLFEFFESD
jgi:hypothetical protein